MTTQFPHTQAIPEGTTAQYVAALRAPDGVTPVVPAQVDAIYLTWADDSGSPINGRSAVAVKDANGGTLSDEGVFAWTMSQADTVAIGPRVLQPRVLTLDIRLVGGGRRTHEVWLWLRNLAAIPAA